MVQQKDWGKQRGNKHLEVYFFVLFLSGGEQKQVHEHHNSAAMWFWQKQQWCHPRACHLDVNWPLVPTLGTSLGSEVKTSCQHIAHGPFYCSQLPTSCAMSFYPPRRRPRGSVSLFSFCNWPSPPYSQGSFCAQVGLERTQSTDSPICKSLLLSK